MVIMSGSLYSPVCLHTKGQQQPSRCIITDSERGIMNLHIVKSQSDLCSVAAYLHASCPQVRWVARTRRSTDCRLHTVHSP